MRPLSSDEALLALTPNPIAAPLAATVTPAANQIGHVARSGGGAVTTGGGGGGGATPGSNVRRTTSSSGGPKSSPRGSVARAERRRPLPSM